MLKHVCMMLGIRWIKMKTFVVVTNPRLNFIEPPRRYWSHLLPQLRICDERHKPLLQIHLSKHPRLQRQSRLYIGDKP